VSPLAERHTLRDLPETELPGGLVVEVAVQFDLSNYGPAAVNGQQQCRGQNHIVKSFKCLSDSGSGVEPLQLLRLTSDSRRLQRYAIGIEGP